MPIKPIPEETLAEMRQLIMAAQGGTSVLDRLMNKPANTAIEGPALEILTILQDLNDILIDPDVKIEPIQSLMNKFKEEVNNIARDEQIRNDPQLKKILLLGQNAIIALQADPNVTYLSRIKSMQDEVEDYATRAANNKIIADVNAMIEITRKEITTFFTQKLQNSNTSWLNPTHWFRSRKVAPAVKPDESLEKIPDYEKANFILENIAKIFTAAGTGASAKAEDARNYELLFALGANRLESTRVIGFLTGLKNQVINYNYIGQEKVAQNKMEIVIETLTQTRFREFEKTPLGAFVIAKRAFDEKSQSLNAKLHKSPDDSNILESMEKSVTDARIRAMQASPVEVEKTHAFNFSQRNEFELLSIMLSPGEYRTFDVQAQKALTEELKHAFPEPELAHAPSVRIAW